MNSLTGLPFNAEFTSVLSGYTAASVQVETVPPNDPIISYKTDGDEWTTRIDESEAGRPFKLSRTGLGDVITASQSGTVSLPQGKLQLSKSVASGVADPGALKIYADSTDSLLHVVDEFGGDTVVGTGDVVGPAVTTNTMIARFDGDTGKLLQSTNVYIDGASNMTGVGSLTMAGSININGTETTPVNVINNNNYTAGLNAGSAITTGTINVALGLDAMKGDGINPTTGSSNIAIGRLAGEKLTTGRDNTIVGTQASRELTDSIGNCCFGINSGAAIGTSGNNNTCVGRTSNVSKADANNQTAIGYGAVCDDDNQVCLGNNAVTQIINRGGCDLGAPGNQFGDVYLSGTITGGVDATTMMKPPTFTVSGGLPPPTIGRIIYVPDAAGGDTIAWSDGVNWRRISDRSVVV